MGLLGLEPTPDFYPTDNPISTSVICPECGAARALHSGRPNWLDLASVDADLLSVVVAWENMSAAIRKAILALVQSAD